MKKNPLLYLMLIPGILFFLVYRYIPIGGLVIAFQDYKIHRGIMNSDWAGLRHFKYLFASNDFYTITKNTLILSGLDLLIVFPAAIVLSLMLNEVRAMAFKRTIQSVIYMPHFLSWVIVGGMVTAFLSMGGPLNQFLGMFGREPTIFMQESSYFRSIVISSSIWKEVGWSTIIYLAAMSGVNPALYEAARMDGAGRMRMMWNITIPSILPTIMILFLLRIGHLLDLSFEQIFVLYNPAVYDVADVIDTYIYRTGIMQGFYSYTAAIGMFKSVVGFVLLVGANYMSRRMTGSSLY
ncbi:ABC transporter permease [Paenibacillus abyssi]